MKRQLISMIAAVMAALMLLCAVSCETDGGDADTTPADVAADVTPAETTTAAPQIKEFTFSSNYVVVRPEDGDDLEIEALTLFMRGVRSAYGVNLKAGDDFVRKGAEVVPGEYEILIGATNRTQSVELSESLSYYDWDYKVVSENVIVICGGSPAATLEATRAFLRDVIGYTEDDVRRGGLGDISDKVKAVGSATICEKLGIGAPTLYDIVEELKKPGRDVREDFDAPVLRDDVLGMEDLKPEMILTGTVRNVIDFGAFVDIGVHQDGLVHISELSDRYVKHPSEVVSVGDVVKVRVLAVDVKKKRISLSMKNVK